MSDSVTQWTVVHQALLSMEFSRQAYLSGLPLPPLGEFPDAEIEPASLEPPALVYFSPLHHLGSPALGIIHYPMSLFSACD